MISDLKNIEISVFHKGFTLASHGLSIERFLSSKPNLFTSDFQFPIMILKESALSHNIDRMSRYCESLSVSLAPHVKTPMSPQIAQRQIDAGAWAITVANFSQASIFLDFGFKRIIIGNEVVEITSIREIARLNATGGAEIIFYLDSHAGLKIIQEAISGEKDVKVNLFLEIGAPGGRAGIRDTELLEELLLETAKDYRLAVRGVAGFEGAVPGGDRDHDGIEKLWVFLRTIVESAKIVAPYVQGDKIIISAGGSAFFDYVVQEFEKYGQDAHIVLRSGGYVSHDHIHYEDLYPFMGASEEDRFLPALEIWARVLSIPEPELAIVNYGKRDAGSDLDNPLPIKRYANQLTDFKARIEKLNDQHAFMEIAKNSIAVGDLVACGISHPCTNFDKWKLIPVVNENYDVIDCVHTFF